MSAGYASGGAASLLWCRDRARQRATSRSVSERPFGRSVTSPLRSFVSGTLQSWRVSKSEFEPADQRIEVEQSQYSQKRAQTAISIGATVVGAMFGRKLGSMGNVGRATTAMRGAGRAAREQGDIGPAKEKASALRTQLTELERKFEDDIEALEGGDRCRRSRHHGDACRLPKDRPRHPAVDGGVDAVAGRT